MPLLGFALVLHTGSYLDLTISWDFKKKLYMLLALNTVAMPLVSLVVMRLSKMIGSYHMPTREERTIPFLVILIYYGLTYYLMTRGELPALLLSMLVGVMVALFAAILINFKWKISIHSLAVGGLAGGFMAFALITGISNWWPLLVLLLLCGVVGTSRLLLNAHSSGQVYAGLLVGFLAEFLAVYLEWG